MSTVDPVRYLGEPAFYVRPDGRIVRTVVNVLRIPRERLEPYSFLSGSSGYECHCFSLTEAVAAATEVLKQYLRRGDITKSQEQDARDYLASIQTEPLVEVLMPQEVFPT